MNDEVVHIKSIYSKIDTFCYERFTTKMIVVFNSTRVTNSTEFQVCNKSNI